MAITEPVTTTGIRAGPADGKRAESRERERRQGGENMAASAEKKKKTPRSPTRMGRQAELGGLVAGVGTCG